MAGRKSDFTLTKLDDLFTTQAQREEEKLSKIRDIPLGLIDDFPDHPFKVRDDEDMLQLIESIRDRGVITPATVRQKEDGRYELISGHRRKRACELAGFQTLRCEVVDLSRDEATILMVESNFQRSQILPSEKAFAYKMRLDREAGEDIFETAKRELQEETGAIKFEIKPICVYSVTGKTRVNDTGEETFGLLCFAEITEFAKELHSEMEKVVLMDELPENWTYPLIQPKLIEKYLQVKIIL